MPKSLARRGHRIVSPRPFNKRQPRGELLTYLEGLDCKCGHLAEKHVWLPDPLRSPCVEWACRCECYQAIR